MMRFQTLNHNDKITLENRSPTVNEMKCFVMAHLNIAFLPKHIDELRLQVMFTT